MYKKYKVKKRKKTNLFLIFFIIMISFFFMSYGYAILTDKLTIGGRANILSQDDEEIGKSTYNWSTIHSWGNGTTSDPKFYQAKIVIINNDGDLSSWTVSFDVQDGIVPEKINAWVASSTTVSGNNITMVCQSWNGNVVNGGELALEFQLAFSNSEPLNITNVKINGKKATLKTE